MKRERVGVTNKEGQCKTREKEIKVCVCVCVCERKGEVARLERGEENKSSTNKKKERLKQEESN